MREEDYCLANDLGVVSSALAVLRNITPENGHQIISKQEYQKAMRLIMSWQHKLFETINIEEDQEE